MEGVHKDKIYMLYECLSERFNPGQWKKIKQLPAHMFLKVQSDIVEQLLHDQKLYARYFENFYCNHVKLLNWSMLATEKKSEILPYVFKSLVNNGLMFYNSKIKEVFEDKFHRVMHNKNRRDDRDVESMKEEIYRDFFNDLLNRNQIEHADKPLNLKLYGRKGRDEGKIDGHQFYIDTFNACNGWKYIFYNYEKHMQGLSEKFKYNQKIRQGQKQTFFEKKSNANLRLLEFEHEMGPGPEACRVEKMSEIFASKKAHSCRSLRSLAQASSVKKMVFVNHQGKPCTYLVSRRKPKVL